MVVVAGRAAEMSSAGNLQRRTAPSSGFRHSDFGFLVCEGPWATHGNGVRHATKANRGNGDFGKILVNSLQENVGLRQRHGYNLAPGLVILGLRRSMGEACSGNDDEQGKCAGISG